VYRRESIEGINLRSMCFDARGIVRLPQHGCAAEISGVPRIPRKWLEVVVFIYPDKKKAADDLQGGGTGFFVSREVPGGWQSFVVTNRHVIEKHQNPVIRLNLIGTSEMEVFVTNRARWVDHPGGDDLSVLENQGIGPFLLGVVWKHFGDPEDVFDEELVPIGAVVKGNSGLAGVIPAAKIKEILDGIPPSASSFYPKAPEPLP
jgi:hypothetical protein